MLELTVAKKFLLQSWLKLNGLLIPLFSKAKQGFIAISYILVCVLYNWRGGGARKMRRNDKKDDEGVRWGSLDSTTTYELSQGGSAFKQHLYCNSRFQVQVFTGDRLFTNHLAQCYNFGCQVGALPQPLLVAKDFMQRVDHKHTKERGSPYNQIN